MATTTGPDLTIARDAVEALMDDTCEIRHDALGTSDDVLDESTGELSSPNPDVPAVYDATTLGDGGRELGGRCKVSPESPARVVTEGGVVVLSGDYKGSIPWDAPVPPRGSVLKITSSRRDPDLVDKEFIVGDVTFKTFLIQRNLELKLRR